MQNYLLQLFRICVPVMAISMRIIKMTPAVIRYATEHVFAYVFASVTAYGIKVET